MIFRPSTNWMQFGDIKACGDIGAVTAGESITALDVCYIHTDGKAYKLNTSVSGYENKFVIMALQTIASDAEGYFIHEGLVENSGWSYTPGYYITIPASSGDFDEATT